LRANFVLAPSVPWSAPLVAIYLWFYWHYLQGKGWPQSTTEFRRTNLRARSLAGRVWRWALLAGGLGWASILALRTLTNMLFALPNDSLSKLSAYPLLLIVSYFLTAWDSDCCGGWDHRQRLPLSIKVSVIFSSGR
jgi:hypothetical protein